MGPGRPGEDADPGTGRARIAPGGMQKLSYHHMI